MKAQFSLSSLLLFLFMAFPASAEQIDCLQCHGELAQGKSVHAALAMGCPVCHSGIDARDVPHRITNKNSKGLSSTLPDLCFSCHERAIIARKIAHGALGMGCSGCHSPHAAQAVKLLKADLPDLCYACHDSAPFGHKNVHQPVAGGQCTSCHLPHSSDQPMLLVAAEKDLCSGCHEGKDSGKHILGGYGLGDRHPAMNKPDPRKPGKDMSCLSCHTPHSSEGQFLFAHAAASSRSLCLLCHSRISVNP